MSQLFIEQLENGVNLDTTIRITKNTIIKHVRPQIYRQNTLPDGDLTLEIVQGSTVLQSQTISYTELNALSSGADYVRGFLRFDTDTVLNHDRESAYTEYILRLRLDNFTSGSGELYLVTDFEAPNVSLHDTFSVYARGYEIYSIDIF